MVLAKTRPFKSQSFAYIVPTTKDHMLVFSFIEGTTKMKLVICCFKLLLTNLVCTNLTLLLE